MLGGNGPTTTNRLGEIERALKPTKEGTANCGRVLMVSGMATVIQERSAETPTTEARDLPYGVGAARANVGVAAAPMGASPAFAKSLLVIMDRARRLAMLTTSTLRYRRCEQPCFSAAARPPWQQQC